MCIQMSAPHEWPPCASNQIMLIAMSTSAPILSANFPHAMAAGHVEDFQIYVLERL